MNKTALLKAYKEFKDGCPYHDPELSRKRQKAIEKAAGKEHKPCGKSEFMTDWVECACGWESTRYWDLYEAAVDNWREHVLKEANK